VVYRFFDEDFVSGGYAYNYPEASKVFIPEESGKNGDVAVQFDLEAADYSGGSICLYNLLYDMTPYFGTAGLQFWIKGAKGGEIALAALVDEENSDGKKTVVRLPVNNYGGIKADWQQLTIPLSDFGRRGVYWDAKKKVEINEPFDWDRVAEFRLEIKKGDNTEFTAWVDDVFIVDGVNKSVPPAEQKEEEYWGERQETVAPPPRAAAPAVKALHTIFDNELPAGAFAYVYGGKTAWKIQPTGTNDNPGVLAMYQDNADYSGVTIALGQGRNADISKIHGGRAALAFWAKASPGVNKVYAGILDDESDGMKVQTKVALSDFGRLDTSWGYFMIPLKKFGSKGRYWDAMKQAELPGDLKWDQVNEFRLSVNRYENKVPEGEPAVVYVDNMTIIEDIPGWVDPDEYWTAFKSDEPDVLLHDFETAADTRWETNAGPKSSIRFEHIVPPEGAQKAGAKALKITYKLGDYCDVLYRYPENNFDENKRDWSRHWGLRFRFHTDKPYMGVAVQINDGGNEVWVASTGGRRGWTELLVPFREFGKFAYYQPPDARENGVLDLKGMRMIDFKPAGEGTAGEFIIDNVVLTNLRQIKQREAAEQVAVTIRGSCGTLVSEAINPGIFGINAALWDGDLLKEETARLVKAVNHGVLRYPGGLRADEDHWKEVLERKDWMVDTDEFLEFCKKTGTEAMITVNFGRGTPEEAAAWVKHVNVDKKYGVKFWEIGNELYGDWHANHCTAEEYGTRAAEFIKAMKAVDPSVRVGVAWVLEGEWNGVVFGHTKGLADAVVVHHYPQHAGEENDFALLAAPQGLGQIIPSVKEQIEMCGEKGKKYQIWLTEWNSVDFNPGPQTLSHINGLFLIDYLGMLATHNIEQASYWDIHNDMTTEGGDYGYLSRTGAPDGDNVPRPSYWAFKLASESLRGKLCAVATGISGAKGRRREDASGCQQDAPDKGEYHH
jgi:hypothetical protein